MRIFRPNNIEWDVNYTTHPPCPCWDWAVTPEMGEFKEVDSNDHHPHCPKRWPAAHGEPGDGEGER